jgi:hypothetical protein
MGSLLRCGFALVAVLSTVQSADAHGIAGNRYFDGTMTIDDPAVADEAIVPDYAHLAQSSEGGNAINDRINWSFACLLTLTRRRHRDRRRPRLREIAADAKRRFGLVRGAKFPESATQRRDAIGPSRYLKDVGNRRRSRRVAEI